MKVAKWLIICIPTVFLLLSALIGFGCYQLGNSNGYSQGQHNGYTQGYSQGQHDGYTQGYSKGHQDGYTQGHQDGYSQGNTDGYNQGYNVGKTIATPNNNPLIDLENWLQASCTKQYNGYYYFTMWNDSQGTPHYSCLVN